MKNIKYLVLGAGPSGLTLAHALLDAGCTLDEVVVIEKQGIQEACVVRRQWMARLSTLAVATSWM